MDCLCLVGVSALSVSNRLSVGMDMMFESVCLFVCPEHNSEMNDPKVFKVSIGNVLGISYK